MAQCEWYQTDREGLRSKRNLPKFQSDTGQNYRVSQNLPSGSICFSLNGVLAPCISSVSSQDAKAIQQASYTSDCAPEDVYKSINRRAWVTVKMNSPMIAIGNWACANKIQGWHQITEPWVFRLWFPYSQVWCMADITAIGASDFSGCRADNECVFYMGEKDMSLLQWQTAIWR